MCSFNTAPSNIPLEKQSLILYTTWDRLVKKMKTPYKIATMRTKSTGSIEMLADRSDAVCLVSLLLVLVFFFGTASKYNFMHGNDLCFTLPSV
jgi:hypothetical protein